MSLDIESVTKRFRGGRNTHLALDDVSLSVTESSLYGIVGESGSGKSTLARCVVGLEKIDSGAIRFGAKQLQPARRPRGRLDPGVQIVFQDPSASLNPRMTVGRLIGEGVAIRAQERTSRWREDRVASLLTMVGLDPSDADRYPHMLSGGQRQRVAIARTMSVEPDVLICDEPVSALDVSIQAQVLALLLGLQRDEGITVVLISHDLAVVRHMCSRVAVMLAGRIVEEGPVAEVLDSPSAEYTRALLDAAAVPDPAVERRKYREYQEYRQSG